VTKSTKKAGVMVVCVELNEATLRVIGYLRNPVDGKPISAKEVLQILADDLGLTQARPECWEAINMQAVIDSHGWETHLYDSGA